MKTREWYVASARDAVSERFPATGEIMEREQMESICVLPLITGERVRGTLFLMAAAKGAYGDLQHSFLEQVASAIAVALDDYLMQQEMRRLGDELAAGKVAALEQQNRAGTDQLAEARQPPHASQERFRDLLDEAPS